VLSDVVPMRHAMYIAGKVMAIWLTCITWWPHQQISI